jgi:hypothetical protein
MDYSSEQIRFDGSMIFRTNPLARWSLFSGIGITAGVSINSNTNIYYSKYLRTEIYESDGAVLNSSSYYHSDQSISENHKNKNGYAVSAYIPMGIDFRVGKKREFWKQIHLFYECRPGMNMTSIPELQTATTASLQHGFGLRVSWQ